MKMSRKVLSTLAVLAVAALMSVPASATSGSGTVAVTATTVASVSLTFVTDGSGIALTGSGTSAATVAFGSVQAYGGSVPANVTKTVNASDWTLSTPIDVVVNVANQTSTDYTLVALLNSADAVNTWKVGSVTITNLLGPITSTGSYGSTSTSLALTIPFSEAAGAISNTINFTATAN